MYVWEGCTLLHSEMALKKKKNIQNCISCLLVFKITLWSHLFLILLLSNVFLPPDSCLLAGVPFSSCVLSKSYPSFKTEISFLFLVPFPKSQLPILSLSSLHLPGGCSVSPPSITPGFAPFLCEYSSCPPTCPRGPWPWRFIAETMRAAVHGHSSAPETS